MTSYFGADRFRAEPCLIPLFLVALAVSGCTDEYPTDMRYPLRTDSLLVDKITLNPRHWDKPGDFPNHMLPTMISAVPLGDREDASAKIAKSFVNPRNLSASADAAIDAALESLFGTPSEPKVGGISDEARSMLQLGEETLARGSIQYRAHCLHCHGLTGNGRGPTAPWVNPHPRDYRQGIFKFTSTIGGNDRKPRREDLLRTIRQGIEGTSMPSFALLTEPDQQALVSYVIHLSIRGNVEFQVMNILLQQGSESSGTVNAAEVKENATDALAVISGRWNEAAQPQSLITPNPQFPFPGSAERKESVLRGWDLFRKEGEAGCIGCHVDYGRQSLLIVDEWGTINRPTDLTKGVYRGGRRRIDLYWRMYNGVGLNMPAFGPALSSNEYLEKNKHDGIWDLVNFLEVLPFKKMRDEMGIQID